MRCLIMVRGCPDSESGRMPEASLVAAMADFHEELARAGVLLDAGGLKPSRDGWRVRYRGGAATAIVDGPFAETKELIAGYTLIQVRSREEAIEWSRRFPSPFGLQDCEIEVRPLFELDDFPDSPGIAKFRELER